MTQIPQPALQQGQSPMKFRLLAALIFALPVVVSAQEQKRRIPRYQYFHCTAVHRILAEAYKQIGDRVSELAQRDKAELRYQEGKKDLIEVGKDPSEAEGRVQKYVDKIIGELEAEPEKIRVFVFGCNQYFPG